MLVDLLNWSSEQGGLINVKHILHLPVFGFGKTLKKAQWEIYWYMSK